MLLLRGLQAKRDECLIVLPAVSSRHSKAGVCVGAILSVGGTINGRGERGVGVGVPSGVTTNGYGGAGTRELVSVRAALTCSLSVSKLAARRPNLPTSTAVCTRDGNTPLHEPDKVKAPIRTEHKHGESKEPQEYVVVNVENNQSRVAVELTR